VAAGCSALIMHARKAVVELGRRATIAKFPLRYDVIRDLKALITSVPVMLRRPSHTRAGS
jgi:tRNA-dihydrouridine synthase